MKLLLHICCGPCAGMPVKRLQEQGINLTGFFYNPNIHPLREYMLRRAGAARMGELSDLALLYDDSYDSVSWMRMTGEQPEKPERCLLCIRQRLQKTWERAHAEGFAAFSTSLLYSRWQPHDAIKSLGEEIAAQGGPTFLYQDFRPYWQNGITWSKAENLYRQQYCGCLYSENERYATEFATVRG